MAIPPASPARVAPAAPGQPAPTPPPPTYAGHVALIRSHTMDNLDQQKKEVWDYCKAVVEFLQREFAPRLQARVGYSHPALQDLSRAETALMFSMTGPQGVFDPSRNYDFSYVESGRADAMVDLLLPAFDHPVTPMPDPRVDANEFSDWSSMNGGRRRRRRTHRRRGARKTIRRGRRSYL
jgi:hypothetical protein